MPLTYLIERMDYVIVGIGHGSDFRIAVAVLIEFSVLSVGIAQYAFEQIS